MGKKARENVPGREKGRENAPAMQWGKGTDEILFILVPVPGHGARVLHPELVPLPGHGAQIK